MHLKQQHHALVWRTTESLKRMRLDKSESYHIIVSQHLKASFKITFVAAKNKKPHTIGE
nr:unnamed protein product [Callosobruchus analis]